MLRGVVESAPELMFPPNSIFLLYAQSYARFGAAGMSLDAGMRYYGLWVLEGMVGVLQAPPLEMQQISPVFLLVGATGRAGDVLCIGRLMRTRVSSLPPSLPPPPRAPWYRIGISEGT